MNWKGVVVGLGQIGMGYDLGIQGEILTHARALTSHLSFELVAGVDSDSKKRSLFEKYYLVPAFSTIEDALLSQSPDIVTVSTPTSTHAKSIEQVLNAKIPRIILCEKPLSNSWKETKTIAELSRHYNCPIAVNFSRLFEPGAMRVGKQIRAGHLGNEIKGVAWYTKGLINNGTHAVNLLQDWLGDLNEISTLSTNASQDSEDPEPDLQMSFDNGKVFLLGRSEEDFQLFEIELVGSLGRLRYERSGNLITWYNTETDPPLPERRRLIIEPTIIKNDLRRCLWHVYDHISKYLGDSEHLIPCSLTKGLETAKALRPWLLD